MCRNRPKTAAGALFLWKPHTNVLRLLRSLASPRSRRHLRVLLAARAATSWKGDPKPPADGFLDKRHLVRVEQAYRTHEPRERNSDKTLRIESTGLEKRNAKLHLEARTPQAGGVGTSVTKARSASPAGTLSTSAGRTLAARPRSTIQTSPRTGGLNGPDSRGDRVIERPGQRQRPVLRLTVLSAPKEQHAEAARRQPLLVPWAEAHPEQRVRLRLPDSWGQIPTAAHSRQDPRSS